MATRYAGHRPLEAQPQVRSGLDAGHPLTDRVITQVSLSVRPLADEANAADGIAVQEAGLSLAPSTYLGAPVLGAVFDGTTSEVDLGDSTKYDFGSDLYSIEALVWLDSTAPQVIFDKDNESTQRQLFFDISLAGVIRIGFSDNAGNYTLFDSVAPPTGRWVHMMAIRTGASALAYYQDGVAQTGSLILATATSVGATSAKAYIGRRDNGGGSLRLSGRVAYLRVYRGDVSAWARSLAENPWQLSAPQASRAPASAAGGGAAALEASVVAISTGTAALTTAIPLAAAAAGAATATAALTTAIPLAAAAVSGATATANLTTSIPLAAGASASCSATAALTTAIPLQASAVAVVTATAELAGSAAALAAAAVAQASASATLTTAIVLQAAAAGQATATADLTVTGAAWAAAAIAQAQASASLTTAITMAATAQAQASASAALTAGVATLEALPRHTLTARTRNLTLTARAWRTEIGT